MSLRNRILTAAVLVALTLAITVGAAKPVSGAPSAPVFEDDGSLVHGVNFMLKTFLDETFCVETDVAVSATPSVYLAPCTGRPNQRWTFTDGEDGSSVVVGDRGFCLKVGHRPEPERLGIGTCDYHSDQRFKVTPAGLIMERHSDDCLTVRSPILSNAALLVEECQDPMVPVQVWRLAQ
ncbi:MAG TPA: ricin-type beta-trefoil lectin domain protein [Candidatus Angelobacter sp.]